MKVKKTGGVLRRALSLLLALVFLSLGGELAPETRAAEKSLTITPGRYIRWRKCLPPEDGNWHRIMLIDEGVATNPNYYLCGNETVDIYNTANYWLFLAYKQYRGLLDYEIPEFDISNDVNYTVSYNHTPAARFVKYDSKNNHDSPAPMYAIRLSDFEGDDGNLTEMGPVPGDMVDDDDESGRFAYDITIPWAFVTEETDDDLSQGEVLVEQFRKGGFFGVSYYLYHLTGTQYSYDGENILYGHSFVVNKDSFSSSNAFIYYTADEISIDTIADGQVIDNDEIVNISGSSYLTLAKDSTLTVKDGGILSIGSGLFNDGTIRVEKGGTLLVKQDAFIMPWQTGQKTGNIVCDGGDVIIYSGGRVVCEGPSGFKFIGENRRYGTVYNYGAIITSAFTAEGKARSFHNEGSVMLGYTVNARTAQAFREGVLNISGGKASVTGLKTGKINVDQVSDGVITGNGVVRP